MHLRIKMYGEFRIDRAGLMWSHKNLFGLPFLTKKTQRAELAYNRKLSHITVFLHQLYVLH